MTHCETQDLEKDRMTHELVRTTKWQKNRMKRDHELRYGESKEPRYFHVTANFNPLPSHSRYGRPIHDPEHTIPLVAERSERLFRHICNKLVPHHDKPRNRWKLPIAIGGVDFPGSKDYLPRRTEMPHVHCLYIVPFVTSDRFKALAERSFDLSTSQNTQDILGDVHCEEAVADTPNLKSVVSYTVKLRYRYLPGLSEERREEIILFHGALDSGTI